MNSGLPTLRLITTLLLTSFIAVPAYPTLAAAAADSAPTPAVAQSSTPAIAPTILEAASLGKKLLEPYAKQRASANTQPTFAVWDRDSLTVSIVTGTRQGNNVS